ncbi:hypothetical protein FALCPG4_004650 [Fusarium falciforme]
MHDRACGSGTAPISTSAVHACCPPRPRLEFPVLHETACSSAQELAFPAGEILAVPARVASVNDCPGGVGMIYSDQGSPNEILRLRDAEGERGSSGKPNHSNSPPLSTTFHEVILGLPCKRPAIGFIYSRGTQTAACLLALACISAFAQWQQAKGPIVVCFENLKVAGVAWGCPILRLPCRPGCFTCSSFARRQRMRIKDNQKPSRNSTHVPPVEALNRPAHAHACVHDNSRPCHLWPVNHGREGTLSNDSIPARSSRHPHAMFGEGDAPIPKERRGGW